MPNLLFSINVETDQPIKLSFYYKLEISKLKDEEHKKREIKKRKINAYKY